MTDNELLHAISNIVQSKIEPLVERMDSMEARIEGLECRMDRLEAKIESLECRMDRLEAKIESLECRVDSLEGRVDSLEGEIKTLNQRVSKIELHLENVTDKNISLLVENYMPAAIRYEKSTAQIETMQSDINVLKKVVSEHSERLQRMA